MLDPLAVATQLGNQLRGTLNSAALFAVGYVTEDEIQRQVCEYVDALKALGLPPERVVVAVKHAAADLPSPLRESVTRWCIERYYGDD